jgi:hypothetical protein
LSHGFQLWRPHKWKAVVIADYADLARVEVYALESISCASGKSSEDFHDRIVGDAQIGEVCDQTGWWMD